MSSTGFDTILDECLARVAAGESIAACLADYPEHASELRAFLSLAAGLRSLPRPEPGPEAIRVGRERMLAAFREHHQAPDRTVSPLSRYAGWIRESFLPKEGLRTRHALRFAVALFFALLIGTNLVVIASAGSLPGDPLYGVKRTWEEARLVLTIREQDRAELLERFMDRRQDEVREMVQEGRQGTLDLEGVLKRLEDGSWSVDGLRLLLSEQTVVDGRLEPGTAVWVRAQVRNDGSLTALRVRIRARMLPATVTEPGGTSDDMPNSRPSPAMTPMPERTPQPTRSMQATDAPEPTVTPSLGETTQPAETREADDTQQPTEPREPDHTPEPAEPPESDHTPAPTRAGDDDHIPGPTETREADHTPEPTGEARHTPEPTNEPEHTPQVTHEPQHTAEPTESTRHTPEPAGEPEPTPEVTGEPHHTPEPTGGSRNTPEPSGEAWHTPDPAAGQQGQPGSPTDPTGTPESDEGREVTSAA